MTATPSPKGVEPKDPEPSALDEIVINLSIYAWEEMPMDWMKKLQRDAVDELERLRSERDEAQKERGELKAANAKLEELVKRARGQLDAGLAALHGENTDEGEKKEWHKMEIS